MSPEEPSHIDNAIWLCANHARLIDRDEAVYTIKCLREMKRSHEAACAEEIRKAKGQSKLTDDLFAIGPGLVCVGALLGVNRSGEVFIAGEATVALGDDARTALRRGEIGFVYQFHHLLPEFSALENIMLPQMIGGLSRREAKDRAGQLLHYLGLSGRGNQLAACSN